jgi:hypothetical protein
MTVLQRIRTGLAIVIIAATAVIVLDACSDENTDLPFAPSGCDDQKPTTGPYEVVVTLDVEFPRIPIEIYKGEIEDNDLAVVDTLTELTKIYDLLVDTKYSAIAIYVIGIDTVAVIGATQTTSEGTEYRDKTCWSVNKGVADLQLRIRP